jgi:regulator of cell morphogenesis and NO signaling
MENENMLEMRSASVADIAVSFPQAIDILNRYQLDYCCNGGRRFVAACDNLKLDPRWVWREIMETSARPETDRRMKFDKWQTPFLIDYIVQYHHSYVREAIGGILALLPKVEAAHGADHPEVVQVRRCFEQLSAELIEHMTMEELVVFPAVRKIEESGSSAGDGSSTEIETPLSVLTHEHEDAGRLIKQIRSLTGNYTPPLHACPSFQLAWKLLKEFDEDLMQHIHLENNILFPRVATAG